MAMYLSETEGAIRASTSRHYCHFSFLGGYEVMLGPYYLHHFRIPHPASLGQHPYPLTDPWKRSLQLVRHPGPGYSSFAATDLGGQSPETVAQRLAHQTTGGGGLRQAAQSWGRPEVENDCREDSEWKSPTGSRQGS